MGANSKIQWTTHTFNPWRGCVKVSEACRHCYAETTAKRNVKVLGMWGTEASGGTRVVASKKMWTEPVKWDRACGIYPGAERPRVFCASFADVFEDWKGPMVDSKGTQLFTDGGVWKIGTKVRPLTMDDVRHRLFQLIYATPNLDWLLLTKRPENAARMMGPDGVGLYAHANGPVPCPQPNVWIGTTVENQATAHERIPHLLRVPAKVRFLSCEPLLGPIEFSNVSGRSDAVEQWGKKALTGINWVIAGSESGGQRRPTELAWLESLRTQCKYADVKFFMKQMDVGGKITGDIEQFPKSLQIRELPS